MGSGAGLSTQGVMRATGGPYLNQSTILFDLPLNDLGAGAVNTTPRIARGSAAATFTRATTKWTKLLSGLWTSVASGTAASCYYGANTAVGAYGGYLPEGAGVQLVTPTASIRDMTNAAWTAVNVTPAKTGTGIDGVVNSCSRLTSGAIGGSIQQTLVAAASSRTYSCFIRRVSGSGTITINQGATTSDITAQLNSSTYTRVSLSASVLNAAFGITFGASGDVIEVDFNQFEAGATVTSPMDAAGAARAADSLTYTATGNINNVSGSMYAEFGYVSDSGSSTRYIVGDSAVNRVLLYANGFSGLGMFDGTNSNTFSIAALSSNSVHKLASSWGGVVMNCFSDGVQGTTVDKAFDGNFDITSIIIGASTGGTQGLFGMVKNVRLYNQTIPNAGLLAMTT